jgi:hypothetical protein
MRLLRVTVLLFAMWLVLTAPGRALADVVDSGGDGEDDDDDDDDKGCATVVAPVSALSLALGVGIVLVQRRRED